MKMKYTAIAIAFAVGVAVSPLSLAADKLKPVTASSLNQSMPRDLLFLCVHTKSDDHVCGYFPRASVMKATPKARKDLYWGSFLGHELFHVIQQ